MKSRGLNVYKGLEKSKLVRFRHPLGFNFHFDYGPKVDCTGPSTTSTVTVKFKDKNTGSYVYSGDTSPGLFTSLYRKWFTPWVVEAYQDGELIYEFDFEKKINRGKVCISIDSSSLGDTLAWVPVAEAFRLKYNCDVYVDSFWSELLCQYYPDLRFHNFGYREPGTDAVFGLGWYGETDRNIHRRDPRTISLQQVAGDILGVDVSGDLINWKVPQTITKSKPLIDGKYVCIAMDSTANAKHWHYPGGWQKLVDHLNNEGYKVVVIQKQPTSLSGVIDKTGDLDILERAVDIYHAQFLIGIGSGLSWLAWSLNKPVIMISGFSDPVCEFKNKNYRIINKEVCNGCFNDPSHKFDRGDWNWCPRLKDTDRRFECTTSITPEMVFDTIKLLEKKELL
jgi:autotransporter strand-loop-strand O-heptosyltransferase